MKPFLILACLLFVSQPVLAQGVQSSEGHGGVVHSIEQPTGGGAEYWTPERMRDAKPMPMPSIDGPGVPQPPVNLEMAPPSGMCTQEAMLCPDGSYVSRTGPNCEFTPCPGQGADGQQDRPEKVKKAKTKAKKEQKIEPDVPVVHSPAQSPEAVRKYWTPERMRDAKPMPMPSIDAGKISPPAAGAPKMTGGTPPSGGTVCAQDVQECPEGNYVLRTGPDCSFAPCSGEEPGVVEGGLPGAVSDYSADSVAYPQEAIGYSPDGQ